MKRVVVTGLGTISSTGRGKEELWRNIIQGNSCIKRITQFDTTRFKTKIGGEIEIKEIESFLQRKGPRPFDRVIGYALYATDEAIRDSELDLKRINKTRVGAVIGSSKGPFATICEVNRRVKKGEEVDSYHLSDCCHGSIPTTIAITYGLQGVNHLVSSASASSAHAIGLAFEKIKYGLQEVIVCGGVENPVMPEIFAMYESTKIMSQRNDEPQRACRPFDKERDGIVVSDGAGILILEELKHAQRREAHIYCELIGYGATADAHHPVSMPPDAKGIVEAMKKALIGVSADVVGYINPHGTATRLNDRMETLAVKRVFGEKAYKIPISSTKSITGHLSGASGGLEAVICSMIVSRGVIPPTINYEHPDPECDLDYVPNGARKQEVMVALSNSIGLGGTNACLAFRKWPGSE